MQSIVDRYSDIADRVKVDVTAQREREAQERRERMERVKKIREERERCVGLVSVINTSCYTGWSSNKGRKYVHLWLHIHVCTLLNVLVPCPVVSISQLGKASFTQKL